MLYRNLGRTGIKVSRLCFGALTVGPLQKNLSIKEGARVIRRALAEGVNFIDTAELYDNYPYIKEALGRNTGETVLVSKCYAYTAACMRESLEKALRALGRDYIDIFMLHEQESILTIQGHWEALEYLLQAKAKGLVRAVGISTHHVAGVLGAAQTPEIDVIHPLLNVSGLGIRDGTLAEMRQAISQAHAAGKGLYAMKALGGGHLLRQTEAAFGYVLSMPELASVAVGMSSEDEVVYNARFFSGQPVEPSLRDKVSRRPRRLLIEDWCQGCGACVTGCHAGALSLGADGQARVERDKCVLCGYCGARCPEFCIKVI